MHIDTPTALLGGLSPAAFMRRHWQKKPLLIRQALPGVVPPADRATLVALAQRDDVESRLVVRDGARWSLRRGPLPRRALPAFSRAGWTVLVQGLDRHLDAAHDLLGRFRFVPDARLDDLMVSYATDGGGVGAHVDSYDVFLLQVQGRRRWRVGRVTDTTPRPGLPLAILARFAPTHDWLLEPGDMLYLPPGWGHDGVADGECITCSIGFRADAATPLADALLQRLAEAPPDEGDSLRYRDPGQPAVAAPARLPGAMLDFAVEALRRRVADRRAVGHALGTLLSEPHREAVFAARGGVPDAGIVLDRATRMLYDRGAIYVNGEHYHAAGRDEALLRRLADRRRLDAKAVASLGVQARGIVEQWMEDGWLHPPAPSTVED